MLEYDNYFITTISGETRDVTSFLRTLSTDTFFGYFMKVIYFIVVVGMEPKSSKSIENIIHDNVSIKKSDIKITIII